MVPAIASCEGFAVDFVTSFAVVFPAVLYHTDETAFAYAAAAAAAAAVVAVVAFY